MPSITVANYTSFYLWTYILHRITPAQSDEASEYANCASAGE